MSRSAKVRLAFGDGAHDFALLIGQLEELQEKCDAGPEAVFNRIASGTWMVADVRETLRLGLIGAGMEAIKAAILVDRYAGSGSLAAHKDTAQRVILGALVGAPDEDDPPGGPPGETPDSPEEKSGSDGSTPTAPQWDGPPPK
ncbi:MAG: gene transfer agent family protein [Minisyncoccia bacterium]